MKTKRTPVLNILLAAAVLFAASFALFPAASCKKGGDGEKTGKGPAHSSAVGDEKPVEDPAKFKDEIENGFICPKHRVPLSLDKKYFANCPERRIIIDTVEHMINDNWSEKQIRDAMSMFQAGQPLFNKIQGAAACPGKNGKLKADFFIMSQCPYGVLFADKILPVLLQELGDSLDWAPHYIVGFQNGKFNSMHGEGELAEDRTQICIFNELGGEKWTNYMRCYSAELDNAQNQMQQNPPKTPPDWPAIHKKASASCITKLALNNQVISACVQMKSDALLRADMELGMRLQANASPTSVYNCTDTMAGAVDYGMLKPYLCSMFKKGKEPETCSSGGF